MIAGSLTAIGAIWGLVAILIFRRFTNRAALRSAVNRIYAHLLEIRLYSDEPSLVWRAQKALVVDNLRFLSLIGLPVLIMAVPFALLYPQFDAIYGWAPLEVGRTAIVTAQLTCKPEADAQYILAPPPGIALESPPVRDFADSRIIWQIRPLSPVRGALRLILPDGTVTRTIAAGDRTLSPNRRREASIEVDYPRANVVIAGLSLPWLVWFMICSSAAAAMEALTHRRRRF